MERRYTREEVEAVLNRAAHLPDQDTFSQEDIEAAGAAVGIDPEAIANATRRLDRSRSDKKSLMAVVVALVLGLGGVIFTPMVLRAGRPSVVVHSENDAPFEVEVLVPRGDCPEPTTAARADFCVWRSVNLAPGAHARVNLPTSPRCDLVWIRTYHRQWQRGSALFELPAVVEIESSGRLDQRGLGAPNMLAAPHDAPRGMHRPDVRIQECKGGLR